MLRDRNLGDLYSTVGWTRVSDIEIKITYRILVEKSLQKWPPEVLRKVDGKVDDNIKLDHRNISCEGVKI